MLSKIFATPTPPQPKGFTAKCQDALKAVQDKVTNTFSCCFAKKPAPKPKPLSFQAQLWETMASKAGKAQKLFTTLFPFTQPRLEIITGLAVAAYGFSLCYSGIHQNLANATRFSAERKGYEIVDEQLANVQAAIAHTGRVFSGQASIKDIKIMAISLATSLPVIGLSFAAIKAISALPFKLCQAPAEQK